MKKTTTTTKQTNLYLTDEEKEVRKLYTSLSTKHNNIELNASKILSLTVQLLSGKDRESEQYKLIKNNLVKGLKLSEYAKQVFNTSFRYKDNKIITNIDLLPFATIKKIVSLISAIDNDKKKKDTLKELKELYIKDMNKKEYQTKVNEFLESNKVTKETKVNIDNEVEKLTTKLSQTELLELIAKLENKIVKVA